VHLQHAITGADHKPQQLQCFMNASTVAQCLTTGQQRSHRCFQDLEHAQEKCQVVNAFSCIASSEKLSSFGTRIT